MKKYLRVARTEDHELGADILALDGVGRSFGSLRAVENVSLEVGHGARHAVIGPNGAGKSTLFDLIGGSLYPTSGTIRFQGHDVTREPEHLRARRGLARTFQHSSVFLRESALGNVMVGVARRAGLGGRFLRRAIRNDALTDRCVALLDKVGLAGRYHVVAGALSHGERRQLEIAMALGTEPTLLLLDEPAAGMSSAETARLIGLLADLPKEVTIVLIEHDLDVVFAFADRVTVVHLGRILMTGRPDEVRSNTRVQEAYLGEGHSEDLFVGGIR